MACNSAHEQTPLSDDTIDSVLRHREVGRAKDLSVPPRSKHDRIRPYKLWCTAMHEDRLVHLRTLHPTYMYFHRNICQWSGSPCNEEPNLVQQDQECRIFATDDQSGSTAYPTWRKKVGAFTFWVEMPSFFRVMLSKSQEDTLCTLLFLLRIFTCKHMWMVITTYEISNNTVMEKRIRF
jgi:hypothetical protein